MIPRPRPERFRLRRTMMFMNAQKPGLIKDAYIYGCDSIMLDLEDAVAENQKDAARFSLYHALKSVDYGDTEVIVRINGLDTPHWQEDVRVCVAGGADGIRIAKCESAQDVKTVEAAVTAAEEAGPHPPHGRPGESQGHSQCLRDLRRLGADVRRGHLRGRPAQVPPDQPHPGRGGHACRPWTGDPGRPGRWHPVL